MLYTLILLMTISVVVSPLLGCLYPSFYIQGGRGEVIRKITESVKILSQLVFFLRSCFARFVLREEKRFWYIYHAPNSN
jgi:hypothetical protein